MNKSFHIIINNRGRNTLLLFRKKVSTARNKRIEGDGNDLDGGEKKVEDRGTTDKQLDWEFIEWI